MSIAATQVGQAFGNYQLERELGQGGMGTVYLAKDSGLNRYVALKILRSDLGDDPSFSRKFLEEVEVTASLAHPNIIRVFTLGEQEGRLYLVMEHLDEPSLENRMDKQPKVSEREVLEIGIGIASALQFAHEETGLIHRDIKPDNMLLDAYGHLRLTDLGLCKKVGDVSPADEPEAILRLLRSQSSVDGGPVSANSVFSEGVRSDNKHRDSGDAMAMSIDGGPAKRDPQTRREVSTTLYVWFIQSFSSSIGLTETHSLSTDGLQYCSK